MRLVTWNINSIRARIDAVVTWVEPHEPDVVLLQETKCTDAAFDTPPVGPAHWPCRDIRPGAPRSATHSHPPR